MKCNLQRHKMMPQRKSIGNIDTRLISKKRNLFSAFRSNQKVLLHRTELEHLRIFSNRRNVDCVLATRSRVCSRQINGTWQEQHLWLPKFSLITIGTMTWQSQRKKSFCWFKKSPSLRWTLLWAVILQRGDFSCSTKFPI